MSIGLSPPRAKSLKDADLKEQLQQLRRTDNLTNWYFLLRTYLFLVVVIGAAVWFDLYRQEQGWSLLWSVPVFFAALVAVGAGQHQLSGLAHEGSHHILFANRYLNELVSDWFCLFPLFSSTHHYRLQHLAHHQFVNDPIRDPDVSQLQTSGHWLNFPLGKRELKLTLLKQLWVPNLIRFIRVRAQYNATGTDKNPYMRKGVKQSKTAVRIGILYLLAQVGALTGLVYLGNSLLLAVLPAALWALALVCFALLPDTCFHQSRLHPVISQRWMSMLRITFLTGMFASVAWITHLTEVPAAVYFFFLWLLPLGTSFSFFMILRQLVQHGNGDRGWLTNTRIFFVGRLINFAVFPIGQEYHLPHHLYATVPHFRLARLHRILLEYPEYHEQALEVHGYFFTPEHPQTHPTVLDVLGPDYAAKEFHGVHIDNTVLEDCVVEEKAEIIAEGEQEAKRLAEAKR
jgi:fatty acid desaturase